VTGGIARVVVESSGVVVSVTGADEPGADDPGAVDALEAVLGVSTVPVVQAPTTRATAMRKARRRSMVVQVIDHPLLDLTHHTDMGIGFRDLIPVFPNQVPI
jgi:xanthine dehydrogenase molybdopterin-binding subunit B